MISDRQLQHHARLLHRRFASLHALLAAFFLLCVEHVRAFALRVHVSSRDAAVLASAASSLTRSKLNAASFLTSPGKANREGSSTRLNAWAVPSMPSMPSMPSLPTRDDFPLHTLGSWYQKVDPTTKPPVYDDDYDDSYSFGAPLDDWPSMDAEDSSSPAAPSPRCGPLRAFGRITGRVRDVFIH